MLKINRKYAAHKTKRGHREHTTCAVNNAF